MLCVLCGFGHVACGQKGAPLAPIVYLPRPVTELKAKRADGDVVLEFKVPTVNTDGSGPADLDRVEVYAHTGPLPAPADFLKYGTLVQAIKVTQPPKPEPEGQRAEGRGQGAQQSESGAPSRRADLQVGLLEQGAATSVRETVTEKHMEIGPMPPTRAALPTVGAQVRIETLETPGTINFPLPSFRYYTVVGVSKSRNRRGPYAGPIRVPLVTPLVAPEKLDATYTAAAISLSWPGHPEDIIAPVKAVPAATPTPTVKALALRDPNQETEGTREIYTDLETDETLEPSRPAAATSKPQPPPTPRFGYNIYEVAASASAPSASASAAGATADKTADRPVAPNAPVAPVLPLNPTLLTMPAFSDPRVEFGTERCYVVRRVEMASGVPIESAPSPITCLTFIDTFAPEPPKMLQSVASGTTVNLIWEANTESDLAGYVILRGEAPGEKLAPLTAAPIGEASYVDNSVRRTRTYVYEVIAVDKAGNQSGPSNRVEDTIR
ncbi:MAG TPA: hypothetical protein VJM31_12815 [Vicinamibacterales bacterium]|nr:hypothetical protein [Vicinamibacterales bacterium]